MCKGCGTLLKFDETDRCNVCLDAYGLNEWPEDRFVMEDEDE